MKAQELFELYEKMPYQALPTMLGGIGLSERKDLCTMQILDRVLKRKIVDLQTNNGDPNEIERLKERKIIQSVEGRLYLPSRLESSREIHQRGRDHPTRPVWREV